VAYQHGAGQRSRTFFRLSRLRPHPVRAADVAAEVTALEEQVLDFNVMVRRNDYGASVEYCRGPVALSESSHARVVFVREGAARPEEGEILQRGDTLLADGKRTRITAGDSTVLYVVTMIATVPLECDGVHHSPRPASGAAPAFSSAMMRAGAVAAAE